MELLKEIRTGLSHLLFPRLCTGCTRPLLRDEETLCISCNLALPRTSFHNDAANEAAGRLAGRVPYIQATAFCYFTTGGLLQHLLHRLKYSRDTDTGLFLGRQFGYDLQAAGWATGIDVIVPVPLHPEKEKARGYNQSTIIAAGMAEVLGIEVSSNNLQRNRPTESQTRKSREARVANVRDAFSTGDESAFRDKHLLLIDDVLTTGATLEAVASALSLLHGVRVSIAAIGLASS